MAKSLASTRHEIPCLLYSSHLGLLSCPCRENIPRQSIINFVLRGNCFITKWKFSEHIFNQNQNLCLAQKVKSSVEGIRVISHIYGDSNSGPNGFRMPSSPWFLHFFEIRLWAISHTLVCNEVAHEGPRGSPWRAFGRPKARQEEPRGPSWATSLKTKVCEMAHKGISEKWRDQSLEGILSPSGPKFASP